MEIEPRPEIPSPEAVIASATTLIVDGAVQVIGADGIPSRPRLYNGTIHAIEVHKARYGARRRVNR